MNGRGTSEIMFQPRVRKQVGVCRSVRLLIRPFEREIYVLRGALCKGLARGPQQLLSDGSTHGGNRGGLVNATPSSARDAQVQPKVRNTAAALLLGPACMKKRRAAEVAKEEKYRWNAMIGHLRGSDHVCRRCQASHEKKKSEMCTLDKMIIYLLISTTPHCFQ